MDENFFSSSNNGLMEVEECSAATKETSLFNRRNFLQTCGLGGLAVACSGLSAPIAWANTNKTSIAEAVEKTVWNACLTNCGGRCPIKCHVKQVNGQDMIVRVSTDDASSDIFGQHQVRACLRGRSVRKRIYSPDRLLYPMKRIGLRGEGKFERISWDEAIATIGEKLKHVINTYGNEALYYQYASGAEGYNFGGERASLRMLGVIGGYLGYYGSYSVGQIGQGYQYTFGGRYRSYSREMSKAKMVLSFGYNPAETRMSGGGETYQCSQWLKDDDVKVVIVDPRYTDSCLGKEDEWLPIRPGTDAALVNAISYVLITQNLVDQEFLDQYCIGYDEKTLPEGAPKNGHYKAYILGQGDDGIAKTPQWAAPITGIPAEKIEELAHELGNAKPAYITQGWGAQRHANGEQTARAIAMLTILTGNVGLPGTNIGDQPGSYNYDYPMPTYPATPNPIEVKIPTFMWTDAIVRGKEMTALRDGIRGADKLNQPIKFIWNYASNILLNQHSDIKKTHKILQDDSLCEFIVVIENHMSVSAKYADILLPEVTNFEHSDAIAVSTNMGIVGGSYFLSPAIKPMGECKSGYEICRLVAKHLGKEEEFTAGMSYDDWQQGALDELRKREPDMPATLTEAREIGLFKRYAPANLGIALEGFRKDPQANPLTTPSGKIEIYSEKLAEFAKTWELEKGDVITPLPQYVSTWEGFEDFETKKEYPLQLLSHHTKGRTHSTYHNVEWLRQAVSDAVWVNPIDAQKRGINDGEIVGVKSKRGELRVAAKITPRIMPGVVSMGEGAWYKPDANGVDIGGCVNTLSSQRPSALGKCNPQHTNLVEIYKLT